MRACATEQLQVLVGDGPDMVDLFLQRKPLFARVCVCALSCSTPEKVEKGKKVAEKGKAPFTHPRF